MKKINTAEATAEIKAPKVLTQSDKIALRVAEKIKEDRSSWIKTEQTEHELRKVSFESTIGTAKVVLSRLESPSRNGNKTVARMTIVISPEGGKPLTISGHGAAHAWFMMNKNAPKSRKKEEADADHVAEISAALGL